MNLYKKMNFKRKSLNLNNFLDMKVIGQRIKCMERENIVF